MGCRHFTTQILLIALLTALFILPVMAEPYRFDAARLFEAGDDPWTNILDDLDGDGRLDLATACYDGEEVVVQLGNGDGTFDPAVGFPVGSTPYSLVSGDLDGDGDIDLATSLYFDDVVLVLLNDGSAGYVIGGHYAAGARPFRMVPADLDGDKDLDLVAANYDGLGVLLNNGDGSFASVVTYAAGENPSYPQVGDVTGDGLPDVLAGNFLSEWGYWLEIWGEVWILPGAGDGTFGPGAFFTTEAGISDMMLADLDGDAVPDLVTLESTYTEYFDLISGNLKSYRGLGNGSFGPETMVEQGRYESVGLFDVDGDGLLDLVGGEERGGVEVIRGTTGGGFLDPVTSNFGITHENLVFGRLDSDGHTDLVAGMRGKAGVLLGAGNGRFRGIDTHRGGNGIRSLDLADLDGDGDPDVLAAINYDYLVSVFENLGDGIFTTPLDHGAVEKARQATAADLDGDGILDLAVVRYDSVGLAIMRGQGNLQYGNPELHQVGAWGRAIAAADLNGDGHTDLVLATNDDLQILRGDGDAGFQPIGSHTTGLAEVNIQVTLADLNNDSNVELIVVSEDLTPVASHLTVFPGLGGGGYGSPVSHPVPPFAAMAVAGDLDDDGLNDVIVTSRGTGTEWEGSIQVFYGYGDGTLADPVAVPAGRNTYWAGITDLDDDGAKDLVSVNEFTADLMVHTAAGAGGFDTGVSYLAGYSPDIAALGDIDGDGDQDVITNGIWGGGITIVRNRTVDGDSALAWVVSGPGAGPANPPAVRLFALPETAAPAAAWTAYGATGFGVNVAFVDLLDDGVPEVVTGPGPGTLYGPHVRAFHLDGSPVPGFDFMAYGTLKYGVNVAAGNLDWRVAGDEVITGAGPGPVFGPHVRGWKWEGQGPARPTNCSFFAYGTPKWGVNVAGGNLDGNSHTEEIVTGPGPGAVYGPHVRAFSYNGAPIPEVSIFAYGTLQFGVKVACGVIVGDGFDEIVTGPGPGAMFAPHVRGWNWDGGGAVQPIEAVNFLAYSHGWRGVNVSCADLDGDGIDEILTGRGPGPALDGRVRGWNFDGQVLTMMPGIDFLAWEQGTITHGATVAGVGW